MSADSQWEVQQAIFAELTHDTGVAAQVASIYDAVPQGDAAFPYIIIGEGTCRDWSSADINGMEQTLTLHIWDQPATTGHRGFKRVKQIMAAIHDTLHDAALTVAGQTLVNLRFVDGETVRDADGVTYHGVARYRAVTQPT